MVDKVKVNRVIHGDCMEVLKDFPSESIESCVTDPPYGLNFMGKTWDDFKPREYQTFCVRWGKRVLRVLKPGAYLLAFSGTRTYHRLVCGLENAGFVIKDQIDWIYGSGFPKSQDISKAIDKRAGEERPKSETQRPIGGRGGVYEGQGRNWGETKNIPQTKEARKWQGWGTALKPAHEPIVLAQKPYEDTYAKNVLKHGVGGLNIDSCRIEIKNSAWEISKNQKKEYSNTSYQYGGGLNRKGHPKGRWPANLILDLKASKMLDEQSGDIPPSYRSGDRDSRRGMFDFGKKKQTHEGYSDKGGASRFFYCAKAHKSERNAGLESLEDVKDLGESYGSIASDNPICKKCGKSKYDRGNGKCTCKEPIWKEQKSKPVKNDIATLKPINLIRYLVRLVTPPKGIVLDPFAGSGTTGIACVIEGFNYILIEKRERFAKVIAPKRIEYWSEEEHWDELKDHNELPSKEELQNKKLTKCL